MSNTTSNKRKLPKVLMTKTTSIFCFGQSFILALFFLYYTISSKEINLIFLIIVLTLFAHQFFFNYRNKKIFLTEKKIYYYSRGKKVLSLPLVGGFINIGYSKSNFGKLFNYGTLKILTYQDVLLTYNFLHDGEEIYEKIISQHIIEARKIDPNYNMVALKGEAKNNKTDNNESIDSIEDNK